jgi:diadenosine tetraphosphate (Ap4A) HIT family hydrolase
VSGPDKVAGCELCDGDGGELVVSTPDLRIVFVDDAGYPGFCRVIWQRHLPEMTDLKPAERSVLMSAVCRVELALREVMAPHKINLASLGNMTPHLHWHVIPRFTDDAHYPSPVWATAARVPAAASLAERMAQLPALRTAIRQHFSPA